MSGVVLVLTLPLLAALLVYLLRRWPLPSSGAGRRGRAERWACCCGAGPTTSRALPRPRRAGQRALGAAGPDALRCSPAAQWVLGWLASGAGRRLPGRLARVAGAHLLPLWPGAAQPVRRGVDHPTGLAGADCCWPPWCAVAAFVIQAGRQGSTRGALRALWLPVLAIPLFLLAAWYVGQAPLDPESDQALQLAGQLASIGLLLLLAPWPLHGPAVSLGEEAPPLVAAWLLTALAAVDGHAAASAAGAAIEWLQGATLFCHLPNAAAGRAAAVRRYGHLPVGWGGRRGADQHQPAVELRGALHLRRGADLAGAGRAGRGRWSGCC